MLKLLNYYDRASCIYMFVLVEVGRQTSLFMDYMMKFNRSVKNGGGIVCDMNEWTYFVSQR